MQFLVGMRLRRIKSSGGFGFPFLRFFLPFSCGLLFLLSVYVSLQGFAEEVRIDKPQLSNSPNLFSLQEYVIVEYSF
jgi:hypothetical protein